MFKTNDIIIPKENNSIYSRSLWGRGRVIRTKGDNITEIEVLSNAGSAYREGNKVLIFSEHWELDKKAERVKSGFGKFLNRHGL